MALSNEFLSLICAPAHGDIAPYFFSETYIDPMEEHVFQWRHFGFLGHLGVTSLKQIFLHRIEIFFSKKKDVAISPRPGAYVGEGICC